jgi:hypothetical protein
MKRKKGLKRNKTRSRKIYRNKKRKKLENMTDLKIGSGHIIIQSNKFMKIRKEI